ncbi:uncharacterized protein MONBRDRAFT_33729 [Monosiga brevicollis MX1]|uniref:RIIa domain-containing protein n=1 Tax=Monosiga brevicollis TaxID=81824 RepID=A9V743_MONBE|nr:uncharacterized protein MONBRDRAFT_33729 [Monosiga brevicollis MX1]EDQ86654.1 predicted protein [Monosiga brevicollis MX1]|eukprot:XP_001748490.1 hypothetical protein [Monosiga brevicollis MX1]
MLLLLTGVLVSHLLASTQGSSGGGSIANMDAAYLRETVGDMLVNAISQCVLKRPTDPLTFIAGYLHKRADEQDAVRALEEAQRREEEAQRLKELKAQEAATLRVLAKAHGEDVDEVDYLGESAYASMSSKFPSSIAMFSSPLPCETPTPLEAIAKADHPHTPASRKLFIEEDAYSDLSSRFPSTISMFVYAPTLSVPAVLKSSPGKTESLVDAVASQGAEDAEDAYATLTSSFSTTINLFAEAPRPSSARPIDSAATKVAEPVDSSALSPRDALIVALPICKTSAATESTA